VVGGQTDENILFISPTIMFNVNSNDKVMQEEIFGPILPFITVSNYKMIKFMKNSRIEQPVARMPIMNVYYKVYNTFILLISDILVKFFHSI
jgi:hypothetical protein